MAEFDIPLSNDRRSRALEVTVSHPEVKEDFLYSLFEKAGPIEKVIFRSGEPGNPNKAVLIFRYLNSAVSALKSLQAAFEHYGMQVQPLRSRTLSSTGDYEDPNRRGYSSNRGPAESSKLNNKDFGLRNKWSTAALFDQPDHSMNDDVFSSGRPNVSVPNSPMFNSINHLSSNLRNIWAPTRTEVRGLHVSPPHSAGWPSDYGSAFPLFNERQVSVVPRDYMHEHRSRSSSERTSAPRSRRIVVPDVVGNLPHPAPPRAQWNTLEFTGVTHLDARDTQGRSYRWGCKKCHKKHCSCNQEMVPDFDRQVTNKFTGNEHVNDDSFASWSGFSKLHI